ncbi:MAG: 23S rRNA (adenine(2503)-C(2))-methyltransferase RlmN [Lachnospiraceae bacterium]|nr:23S rRNA (adenine(2503)-C(2))-methyltransferase RlmN [Lachnospiraceae bacterium]
MEENNKIDIKSLNLSELEEFILSIGEKKFRAKQIYEWLHIKLVKSFDEMSNISVSLREKLKECATLTVLEIEIKQVSKQDQTSKYLFRLPDGKMIESVWMKYKHGNSVCVSSQVGCRMGCRFCASTVNGLDRSLMPSEILEQIYEITRDTGERVSNVIIMGIGEPFDNYDNVMKFIRLLTDKNGLNVSERNVTVSTCGLVEKIYKLAEEDLHITLAVSLHAPNDKIRQEMMPIANKYSIAEIVAACKNYIEKTGRRVTFEYTLVDNQNDSDENAQELSALLKNKLFHVNLIPLNKVEGKKYNRSKNQNITRFKDILERNGLHVTVRRELGSDISAACGQLVAKNNVT